MRPLGSRKDPRTRPVASAVVGSPGTAEETLRAVADVRPQVLHRVSGAEHPGDGELEDIAAGAGIDVGKEEPPTHGVRLLARLVAALRGHLQQDVITFDGTGPSLALPLRALSVSGRRPSARAPATRARGSHRTPRGWC